MNKRVLLTALLSGIFFVASPLHAAKNSAKKNAVAKTSNADSYDDFDSVMDVAFEDGVLDKPIELKKPSFFKRMLTKFGLPVALKLLAWKKAIQNWWRMPRKRAHAKA